MKVGAILLQTTYILHFELILSCNAEYSRNHKKAFLFIQGKVAKFFTDTSCTFCTETGFIKHNLGQSTTASKCCSSP